MYLQKTAAARPSLPHKVKYIFLYSSLLSRTKASAAMATTKLIDENISKNIIDTVDSVLFDCDGVLWDAQGAIEGSLETVLKIKELGKKVFYISNNSTKSRSDYAEKCKNYGFPVVKEEIACVANAVAAYLQKVKFQGKIYMLGKDESMGAELTALGYNYIGIGPDPVSGFVEQWVHTKIDPEVKCVVVGFDDHISYMKILKAATYLRDPNCLFVATNEDNFYPARGNVTIPATGCMVVPIAHAAKRRPIVVGKPEIHMFEVLREVHGIRPERCLMVGDQLQTDIGFAKNCGMLSLLVLTGVSSLEDIGKPAFGHESSVPAIPDYYAPKLADFGKFL